MTPSKARCPKPQSVSCLRPTSSEGSTMGGASGLGVVGSKGNLGFRV